MSNSKRIYAIVLWAILLLLSTFLLFQQLNRNVISFDRIEDFKDPQQIIREKLEWLTQKKDVKGKQELLMTFTDSITNKQTELYVSEGKIDSFEINPSGIWKPILKGQVAMLVNSPDEYYDCDVTQSAISYYACKGCNIKSVASPIPPGNVSIDRCYGSLHKNGYLTYVANAVVVNFQYYDGFIKKSSLLQGYDFAQQLWQINACKAINNVFDRYDAEFKDNRSGWWGNDHNRPTPEIWIFPAIGTNHGGLPANVFYDAFFAKLDSQILKHKLLPTKIFLNVYRDNLPDERIYNSIYSNALNIYQNLSGVNLQKYLSEWMEIIGIICAILLSVLFINFFIKKEILAYSKETLDKRLIILTIGHALMAYGFIKSLEKISFINSFFHDESSIILPFIIGFISLPLSFIIPLAKKTVDSDKSKAAE